MVGSLKTRGMKNRIAAVVGTGFIGPVHVEGLRRAGVRVAGILGSTVEKSQAAAAQLGLPKAYTSLDQLLEDGEVDVVHLTSPNRFHYDQAKRVLAAGKHVLCEKPLAMNSRESSELVELAKQSGRAAGVNYNIRYYPLCVEASQRVRQGKLGNLFHVNGSYVQDWLFHPTDFNWRVMADDGGPLRAVADIGTHWLDLIQFIVGQPILAVCADLATVHPQRQRPVDGAETFGRGAPADGATNKIDVRTEDYGCILLRFREGAKGALWVSQVTAGRKNCLRFEMAGSQQSLSWNSETPNQLEIGHRDEANETLIRDPALISTQAAAVTSYPGGHNEGFGDSFKQLFLDFYKAIETPEDAGYPTFQDGHHEILICEAILNSHRRQSWVEIGDTKNDATGLR